MTWNVSGLFRVPSSAPSEPCLPRCHQMFEQDKCRPQLGATDAEIIEQSAIFVECRSGSHGSFQPVLVDIHHHADAPCVQAVATTDA